MATLESCACAAKIATSRWDHERSPKEDQNEEGDSTKPLRSGFRANPRTRRVQAMRWRPTHATFPLQSKDFGGRARLREIGGSPGDRSASAREETRSRSDSQRPSSNRREQGWEGRPRPRRARAQEATSKGNKAQEGQADGTPSTADAGTDCLAEKGLGGPIPRRYDTDDDAGNGGIAKVADRRRSKVRGGKGARRRASAAGEESPSRGMKLDAGKCPSDDQQGRLQRCSRFRGWPNHRMKVRKRIEPHDWQQDATSLQVIQRNKPTRS